MNSDYCSSLTDYGYQSKEHKVMSQSFTQSLDGSENKKNQPKLSLNQILSLFNSLPESDRIEFIKQVLPTYPHQSTKQHYSISPRQEETIDSLRFPDCVYCLHCGSTHIIKRGISAQGKQRYLCKDCKHSFQASTRSIFDFSKKGIDTWIKYIECISHQFSIRKSAFICGISVPTSFYWRHKILDLLNTHHNSLSEKLSGVVEADETFFHLSFKGNRKMKLFTDRKPHKRGSEVNKRGLSKEQVCVPCAVSIDGKALSMVGKLGIVNLNALTMTLGGKIEPNSVLCTDRASSYIQFCKRFHLNHNNSGLSHVAKLLNVHNSHIQHINAYHSGLKTFMFPFKGVATKYLNNYLGWYNRKRVYGYSMVDYIKKIVFSYEVVERRDWISERNPIPVVA